MEKGQQILEGGQTCAWPRSGKDCYGPLLNNYRFAEIFKTTRFSDSEMERSHSTLAATQCRRTAADSMAENPSAGRSFNGVRKGGR